MKEKSMLEEVFLGGGVVLCRLEKGSEMMMAGF